MARKSKTERLKRAKRVYGVYPSWGGLDAEDAEYGTVEDASAHAVLLSAEADGEPVLVEAVESGFVVDELSIRATRRKK
jgi:hypothetical protein